MTGAGVETTPCCSDAPHDPAAKCLPGPGREATCHPYDEPCDYGTGGPCRNHGGTVDRETPRSTTEESAVDIEVEPYTITPHPPHVQQVCNRCGCLVGDRVKHDAWHQMQEDALNELSWRTRGSRCPHA